MKRSASSSPRKRPRKGCLQDAVATQTPPPPPTMCLTPGQTMWVMTTAGLVQLAPAPPPGMVQLTQAPPSGLALIQSSPLPPQPEISPQMFLTLPPHTAALPVRNPSAILTLPYRGVVKVDSAKAPLLRREALQFDPSLIFPEPLEAVRDWLSGRGGVVVPGARVALPYMPPFVGSLSTLTALLRSMKSLKMTSLQLLDPPRCRPKPTHQTRARADQPELADSIVNPPGDTSDLPTADPLGDPSELPTTDPLEEEQVKAVRRLVAERFSTNPAYQLLKARFLSCFTVPALLATIQPVATEMMTRLTNEEEEEEEEEELRRIEKRGRRRRTEVTIAPTPTATRCQSVSSQSETSKLLTILKMFAFNCLSLNIRMVQPRHKPALTSFSFNHRDLCCCQRGVEHRPTTSQGSGMLTRMPQTRPHRTSSNQTRPDK